MGNGRIRQKLRALLGAIGMPEQRMEHKKPDEYTFLDALAGKPPQQETSEENEDVDAPRALKGAKVPSDLVEIVVVVFQAEGMEGSKEEIKSFEVNCADEIQWIIGQEDRTVREVHIQASAERYAMMRRPRADNSHKRKGIFPF